MSGSGQASVSGTPAERRELFTRLFMEHGPAVMRWLAPRIPQRFQALLSIEDVLQQSCTDAFLQFEQFLPRTDGSFGGWLGKIAERNLINALRMLKSDKRGGNRRQITPKSREDSFCALYEELTAGEGTPSRNVARGEARAALESSIRQLPEDYRMVVQMFDLDGKSAKEVAQALGRSPGAVYMIRARAHRWLGDLLGSRSRYISGP
jgi:RNA polymerase sigma-70 factor (ECF subfamily)